MDPSSGFMLNGVHCDPRRFRQLFGQRKLRYLIKIDAIFNRISATVRPLAGFQNDALVQELGDGSLNGTFT